jgi:hypothetical protein
LRTLWKWREKTREKIEGDDLLTASIGKRQWRIGQAELAKIRGYPVGERA